MLKPLNKTLIIKLKIYQKSKVDITTTADESDKNLILAEITAVSDQTEFKIGDQVIVGKYAFETFEYEGEKYLFIQEEDIIALKI